MMISSLVIFSVGMRSGLYQGLIHVGAAVAEELPGFADFGNHIEVEVGGEDLVFVARRLGEDAAAGIAEIARAVEFADIPRGFGAHAVDGADEIAVGPRWQYRRNARLQWDRDVSSREMGRGDWEMTQPDWLQWGRNVSIPEMQSHRLQWWTRRRFNGAGMFPS